MSDRSWYRSIYWRIALGFILFLAIVLVVQGALFVWIVARAEGAIPAHSLVDLANVIASDLGTAIRHEPALDIDAYVRDHYGNWSRGVFVVMGDGRVYASHEPIARSGPILEAGRLWLSNGAPSEVQSLPSRAGRLAAFSQVFVGTIPIGIVAVQPGPPSSVLREILPTMLVIAAALIVSGTGLAALLIFGPANRRLKALEEAAHRLGGGDLSWRAPTVGGDEISAVAQAFNQMAEDLAERAHELAESDRARRQLLADVSHELMTPLTAIRGYVETLAMPDLAFDDEKRRRYLGIIEEETLRLETIVGDLLDLARLSAGGGTLDWQEVRVRDLFDRVSSRHERASQQKNVTLSTRIEPGAETVYADPDRLEQALQNLAANGLRHTPAGGRVELRATRSGDGVLLQVRDNGEGIPPQHLPLIFDRFYKVSAARGGSGSGLGLSIVKAIVERHGGSITVRSEPGVETVFEILLAPAGPVAARARV